MERATIAAEARAFHAASVPRALERSTRSQTKRARGRMDAGRAVNTNAKRPRVNIPFATKRHSCVVCGGSNGPVMMCKLCHGAFHQGCLDPPVRRLSVRGWTCGVCTPTPPQAGAGRGRRVSGVAAFARPTPVAAVPRSVSVSTRRSPSARIVASVWERLSGEGSGAQGDGSVRSVAKDREPRLNAQAPKAMDASAPIRGTSRSGTERGARKEMMDSVLAWAMDSVGGGRLEDYDATAMEAARDAAEANAAAKAEARAVMRARKEDIVTRSRTGRGDTNSRGGGNAAERQRRRLPRCHCNNPANSRKRTVPCEDCDAVFHLCCMKPPRKKVTELPRGCYTCLACRPACKVCDAKMSSVSGSKEKWGCFECSARSSGTDDGTGNDSSDCEDSEDGSGKGETDCTSDGSESTANSDYSADSDNDRSSFETSRHARSDPAPAGYGYYPLAASGGMSPYGPTRGPVGVTTATAGATATAMLTKTSQRNLKSCAVCGVADDKKINVCGSCGDVYHSRCLDKPRTRRAGNSWRCDRCRDADPLDPAERSFPVGELSRSAGGPSPGHVFPSPARIATVMPVGVSSTPPPSHAKWAPFHGASPILAQAIAGRNLHGRGSGVRNDTSVAALAGNHGGGGRGGDRAGVRSQALRKAPSEKGRDRVGAAKKTGVASHGRVEATGRWTPEEHQQFLEVRNVHI